MVRLHGGYGQIQLLDPEGLGKLAALATEPAGPKREVPGRVGQEMLREIGTEPELIREKVEEERAPFELVVSREVSDPADARTMTLEHFERSERSPEEARAFLQMLGEHARIDREVGLPRSAR